MWDAFNPLQGMQLSQDDITSLVLDPRFFHPSIGDSQGFLGQFNSMIFITDPYCIKWPYAWVTKVFVHPYFGGVIP